MQRSMQVSGVKWIRCQYRIKLIYLLRTEDRTENGRKNNTTGIEGTNMT